LVSYPQARSCKEGPLTEARDREFDLLRSASNGLSTGRQRIAEYTVMSAVLPTTINRGSLSLTYRMVWRWLPLVLVGGSGEVAGAPGGETQCRTTNFPRPNGCDCATRLRLLVGTDRDNAKQETVI
jgi:hypothetical protein